MDNYATHKTQLIRNWLAKRPRWHVHLTPISSSWLNQVERFFALITERKARHLSKCGGITCRGHVIHRTSECRPEAVPMDQISSRSAGRQGPRARGGRRAATSSAMSAKSRGASL
jgi:hypothetical protein